MWERETFHGNHGTKMRSTVRCPMPTLTMICPFGGSGQGFLPNGLSDLTKRENRFLHNFIGTVSNSTFPYENVLANISSASFNSASSREGEDIVLTNVLAFDVRVFDPDARVRDSGGGVALIPGDPGYATNLSELASGAYIDLGVSNAGTFASMETKSQLTSPNTYDTWSDHYEFNGIDEDEDGVIDQKNNMIDDDSNGISTALLMMKMSLKHRLHIQFRYEALRSGFASTTRQLGRCGR